MVPLPIILYNWSLCIIPCYLNVSVSKIQQKGNKMDIDHTTFSSNLLEPKMARRLLPSSVVSPSFVHLSWAKTSSTGMCSCTPSPSKLVHKTPQQHMHRHFLFSAPVFYCVVVKLVWFDTGSLSSSQPVTLSISTPYAPFSSSVLVCQNLSPETNWRFAIQWPWTFWHNYLQSSTD